MAIIPRKWVRITKTFFFNATGGKLSLCVQTQICPSHYPVLNSLFFVSTLDFLFHLEAIFFPRASFQSGDPRCQTTFTGWNSLTLLVAVTTYAEMQKFI